MQFIFARPGGLVAGLVAGGPAWWLVAVWVWVICHAMGIFSRNEDFSHAMGIFSRNQLKSAFVQEEFLALHLIL